MHAPSRHARSMQGSTSCCCPRSASPRARSSRTCRAAEKPGPLVRLERLPDAEATVTVVERRAADVAVVGGGITAVLAAYSLAKAGKKVLLLPDYGLSGVTPASSSLQPLKLPDIDPLLVHMAAESGAYWRGLELLASAPLLSPQQTCDLVLQPDRDHPGAAGFSQLQESCVSAGVTAVPLSSSEAMTRFRQLQLPPSSACLMQPDGGVLHATDAGAAARQLAENVGVVMRPGLLLRGWRDRGSCFQLRASSRITPELVSQFEAEVLLLAPGHWPSACLGLFGLQLEGVQAREVLQCRLPGGMLQQQQQLPVWQSWGAFTPPDQPLPPAAVAAMPLVPGGSGWALQQLPAGGLAIEDPRGWQPADRQWRGGKSTGKLEQDAASSSRSTSNSSSSWVDIQVQQLHQTCAQLVRDVGPVGSAAISSAVRSCVADGRPLLGQHPDYDSGRVIVCAGASGSEAYGPGNCSSSYQLSPMLAKLAADMVKSAGAGGGGAVVKGIALQREGVTKVSSVDGFDGWERLDVLQHAQALSEEDIEREADEASDRRQDLANLKK